MSTAEPTTSLLGAVLRGLARTSTQHATFSHALATQLGIGPTDLDCLTLLQDLGSSSAGQLAEQLNLTTGAITGVVDRLVSAGFVVRDSDPADRRRVIVRPVPERMADLDRAYEPLLRTAHHVLSPYSERDLQLLLEFHRLVSAVIQHQTERLRAGQVSAASPALSAPLGGVTEGRLEFATGASGLRVYSIDVLDARQPDAVLYQASFDGAQPTVRVAGGEVNVRYRRMSPFEWGKHAASVGLNPTIPWRIALSGGASNVAIDARGLQLRELTVSAGARRLEVWLPPAWAETRVCLAGGVDRVQVHRPLGAEAQLVVHGGANRLGFDAERFGAVGGDIRLTSANWELVTDRYTIEVSGGASRLELDEIQEV